MPIPPNASESWGRSMKLSLFDDTNHAGNVFTQRLHSGFVIFIGRAQIMFHLMNKNTVDPESFGS